MAIIKPKSVNAVLKSMSKLLADLKGVEDYHIGVVTKIDGEIDTLEQERDASAIEASRAAKVHANFTKLMEA